MTRTRVEGDLSELVRLDDPAFFLGDPYPVYARMHHEQPVMWCESVNAFAVTKHADVRVISRDATRFTVTKGIMLNDAKYGRNTAVDFFPDGGELIVTTDPPRHTELRRVIAPAFAPRAIAGPEMEATIRDFARQSVAGIEAEHEIDFVEQVAVPLPIRAILRLLGLPGDNVGDVRRWTDEMVKMGAAVKASAELDQIRPGLVPLFDYLLEHLNHRRRVPGSDDTLMSALLAAELDNEKLTDLNVLMLTTAVLVAGNETTRNLSACMAWALAQHPDQLARLREDRSLVPRAVDESLRWMSPVIAHMRTATTDTEVRGVEVKAGQHLHLLYAAANHDAEVFADPGRYDVGRRNEPMHIAFGDGAHVCPGSSLARLEARILFEELLDVFSTWELSSAATRHTSVLHNGFVHLPLTFRR